jgi:hypothetical protein
MDAGEHGLLAGDAGDPVEGGVREDGVELIVERERCGVLLFYAQVALAGGSQHCG